MRPSGSFVLVLLIISLSFWATPARAAQNPQIIHVSPTGNDNAAGTSADPLQTLPAARDRIRAQRDRTTPVTVQLHEGRYHLNQSFRLDNRDSGTLEAPITYRAAPGERAVVTGAQAVPNQAVQPVSDPAIRRRLAGAVADQVRQVDLRALGITDLGTRRPEVTGADRPTGLHLIQGDVQGRDARYPDHGHHLTIGAVRADGANPRWRIDDAAPFAWAPSDDLWVAGFPGVNWGYQVQKVIGMDRTTRTLTLGTASEFGSRAGQPFSFVHVLEGLNQPDEFYVDAATGRLYFIPTGAPLSVTTLSEPLVAGADVSFVRFEGIEFTGARGNGLEIIGGRGIEIRGGTFTNLGLRAVRLEGVTDSVVDSVRISRVGHGGVDLEGGDRATLTPGRNLVTNNRIDHFAETYPRYSPGVAVRGVGNTIRNNEISHSPHLALQLQGNDHVIDANYVHDVVLESSDSGALYGGRDWTERGNVISNNVFARVGSGADDVSAIYLDDMMSGTVVRRNLVVDAPVGVQHSGRDNDVSSNIFVRTKRPVYVGNWAQGVSGPGGALEQRLREVPYQSPAWSKYPHLANILEDEPRRQKYNTVSSNAFVASGPISLDPESRAGVTQESNVALPEGAITTGPELADYRVPGDSPIRRVPGLELPELGRVGPNERGPVQPDPADPGSPTIFLVILAAAAGLLTIGGVVAWRMARRRPGVQP